MDWTYKHFHREAVFAAPAHEVRAAAHAIMSTALGWRVSDTADGFAARGHSGAHAATATFHLAPAGDGGTRVAVALAVTRANAIGFILWDAGHYYDRQLRHWLDAIRDHLAGGPAALPAPPRSARFFGAVIVVAAVGVGLGLGLHLFVFPVIGLFTGNLYLLGRGSFDLVLQGPWARIVSVALLSIGLFVLYRIWKPRKPRRP